MAVHDSLIYSGTRLLYDTNTDQLIYGDNCHCCELNCEGAEYFCRYLHCSCYDVASYRCCIKGDIDHPEISNYDPGWLLANIGDGEWQYSGPGADGTTSIVINLKIVDISDSGGWVDFRLLVSSGGGEWFLNRTSRRTTSSSCINCAAGPFDTVPLIYFEPFPGEPGFWIPDDSKCNYDNGVPCIARCKPTNNDDNWIATVTLSGISFWGWDDDDTTKFPLTYPLPGSHYSPTVIDWAAGGINGTHVLTPNGCCKFRKEFDISYEVSDYLDWWNDPKSDHSDNCPGRYTTRRTITDSAKVVITFTMTSSVRELKVSVSGLKGFGMKHNWDGFPGCSGIWRSGSFGIFKGRDSETTPTCENDLNASFNNDYTAWRDLRRQNDSNYWIAGKNGSGTVQLSGL